jgi:AbrB family looped-hinge helix DNA binding protein
MSRVTSKLQVTIPKVLAEQVGICVGDDVRFEAAGDVIVLRPERSSPGLVPTIDRLALFDEATERQRQRDAASTVEPPTHRDWTREELYERARPR